MYCQLVLHYVTLNSAAELRYFRKVENDIHWAHGASIVRFCNRLRHFFNAQNVFSIRCGNTISILLFLHFHCFIYQY